MKTDYLRRSWRALTGEKKWLQTILILSLVQLIPVLGQIVVLGYFYQWARDAAWGIERGLPTNTSGLGHAMRTGFIAFVDFLCWFLVLSEINHLLSRVPHTGVFLEAIFVPVFVACCVFAAVMVMRATLYDSATPCFQFAQAADMAQRDFLNLLKVLGVFLISLLVVFIAAPVAAVLLLLEGFGMSGGSLGVVTVLMLPLVYLCVVIFTTVSALAYRSLGYWTAEFKPATWGVSSDGLPGSPVRKRASSNRQPRSKPPKEANPYKSTWGDV